MGFVWHVQKVLGHKGLLVRLQATRLNETNGDGVDSRMNLKPKFQGSGISLKEILGV